MSTPNGSTGTMPTPATLAASLPASVVARSVAAAAPTAKPARKPARKPAAKPAKPAAKLASRVAVTNKAAGTGLTKPGAARAAKIAAAAAKPLPPAKAEFVAWLGGDKALQGLTPTQIVFVAHTLYNEFQAQRNGR